MTPVEQALAKAVKRRLVREAVVKDTKAYERLYRELQGAMTNSWEEATREGIANALDRLRDLGPGSFNQDDAAMIMRVLEGSVGTEAIQAAMRQPVLNLSEGLFRAGAEEIGKAAGISLSFGRPDLDALDILKSGNLFWVGNSWNVHTQELFSKTLETYFTEGLTREQLTARFAEDFVGLSERGQRYWEMLADHTATKTREMGRVTGYERASARFVQVRAQLDANTSEICRHMHGRVIEVSALRAQRDAYLDAVSRRDETAAKNAWTMHGANADLSKTPTNKLGKDTASPPYHFRCRTITVIYFDAGSSQVDTWQRAALDRKPLSRKQVGELVDQAKSARWPHQKVSRGHYRKHQGDLGFSNQSGFNQAAIDLVRRGNRDIYLSVRNGRVNATFVAPKVSARSGRAGFELVAVDLVENKITTYSWRSKLKTTGDEVPNFKQPGRGVAKWLIGF